MGGLLKSRWAWAAGALAALLGLYALLGLGLAPGLVRKQAIAYVSQAYGRELQIGEVRIQPFTLQLEIRDLALPDRDRQPMLGLKRLFVDFELSSLWRRAYVFRELTLESPSVRAVLRHDGTLNLADLAPPEPASPPPAKAELPRVWIESLAVGGGSVEYVDLRHEPQPLKRSYAPVTFALTDFWTTAEGGAFQFSARSAAGEKFGWKGRLELAPAVASQGEFTIEGLRAAGVAELLGDALPFGLSSGSIDLAGSYRLSLAGAPDLKLKLPRVALSGLGLRARGADADWVTVPSLVVEDTAVALPERSVTLGKVALAGLKATAWLDADGSVNLQRLFAPAAASAPAAPPKPQGTTPARAADATPPWTLKLAALEVTEAAIEFEDRMRAPVKRFAVAPLRLSVRGASLDLAQPLQLAAEATINDQAVFKAEGQVTPQPLAAELELSLQGARLEILQPYILPVADLTLRSGTLGATGKLRIAPPAATGARLAFEGGVTVEDFKSTDNALGQDLIDFHRLELRKLRFAQTPDALSIDSILVSDPYARVIISPDQVLNISAVLDPKGAAAQRAARKAQADGTARPPEPDGRESAQVPAAAAGPAPDQAGAGAGPRARKEAFPIRIREVRVTGGRLNFSDLNVQPNFSADVRGLKGAVTGLSSDPASRAKVDMAGRLDEYSPVLISGQIQPFAYDRYTDLGLSFKNVSLPVFNPYAGRFAGYSIAKGKLDTTLHYLVQNRQLQATHKIRIDQLEWGEATATKGEATLPVKFATVLLRDRNGVIDLDIPVAGSLDDPELSIGPIVWQIIKNLIVKAVSAPFSLIASLFSGAEDAQYVDFEPGDSTLAPAAAERLAVLARGLVEKPGLELDIPIGTAAELDGPALAERHWRHQLGAATATVLRRGADDPSPLPAFDSLPATQQIAALGALIRQHGGTVPRPPAPRAPAAETAAAIEQLEKEARSRVGSGESDLGTLGQERARAVQRALLAGGELEPARVFLTASGPVSAKDGKVRFELGLK
jgi:hypothetical protein